MRGEGWVHGAKSNNPAALGALGGPGNPAFVRSEGAKTSDPVSRANALDCLSFCLPACLLDPASACLPASPNAQRRRSPWVWIGRRQEPFKEATRKEGNRKLNVPEVGELGAARSQDFLVALLFLHVITAKRGVWRTRYITPSCFPPLDTLPNRRLLTPDPPHTTVTVSGHMLTFANQRHPDESAKASTRPPNMAPIDRVCYLLGPLC